MEMIPELYSIICDTYRSMNRTFDVPLAIITKDSELKDLGIDDRSMDIILMNIESRMNVSLPVYGGQEPRYVGDVITMIEYSK